MRLLPLRILAVFLGLGLTGTLAWAAGEEVKFDTADRVEIHGTFYPSTAGKKAFTVLMLHKIGANSSSKSDSWQKLAEELQKKGCAVLTFDFRGHGDSTTVDAKEFWAHPTNKQFVAGFGAAKPKETILFKDFKPGYLPTLVNDIMAAKLYLDRRNDANDCNSGKLVILGAEEGATLGLMWAYAEEHRFLALPNVFPARYETKAQGKDIVCCLWLSMKPTIGSKTARVNDWLKQVGVENKVEMSFVYGAEEPTGKSNADVWMKALKAPDKSKPFTLARPIEKTKLSGQALVSEKLDTIKLLTNFIGEVMKDDKADNWERREIDKNAYIWRLNGKFIPAKLEKQKEMLPLPLSDLGIAP